MVSKLTLSQKFQLRSNILEFEKLLSEIEPGKKEKLIEIYSALWGEVFYLQNQKKLLCMILAKTGHLLTTKELEELSSPGEALDSKTE
jgi:hypothetical protein